MKYPLLALAGSFALGIIVGNPRHAPASAANIPITLGAAGVCLLAGLIALRRDGPKASLALGLTGFVFAGAAAAELFPFRFPPGHVNHLVASQISQRTPVGIEGYLVSNPVQTSSELQMDVNLMRIDTGVGSRPTTGKVRLWIEPSSETQQDAATESHLRYGDVIRAQVLLRRPRVYRNPGSFNFRERLESIDDLYWDGTVERVQRIEPSRAGPLVAPGRLVERVRARLLQGIDRLYPPWSREGRDGAVLKAVLLGDRSSLDSATVESFRKSGLYHLLVVAGLHVGLLALLATGLFRLLGFRRRTRTLLLLVFLLGYALLVEQRAPTLRATVMIVAFLLAGLLDREHRALNAVGLAALALLVSRPAWLWEAGFQLSFGAALLIAGLAAPILERTIEPYRRALDHLHALDRDPTLAPRVAQFRLDLRSLEAFVQARFRVLEGRQAISEAVIVMPTRAVLWTANIVLFSAILQIGLLLPMAETFHRITLAGIGLNALAIPVMTVLLAVAFPTMLLASVAPAIAVYPAKVLELILRLLFALTQLPHLPAWLSYRIPSPPAWVALGFGLSIVTAAIALGRSRWALGLACAIFAVFAALVALYPFAPRLPSGILEVTALDCGGGDATFMVLPDRTTILAGACGGPGSWRSSEGGFRARPWDPGENIVSPYLWSRGIKKIDILVLADAHGNHLSGLDSILRNFRVGKLWLAPLESGPRTPGLLDPRWGEILEAADTHHARVEWMTEGRTAERGQARLDILWPPHDDTPDDPGLSKDRGHDSLAIRIRDGKGAVLLPGDITNSAEAQLVDSETTLESTVFKVGHQGAKSAANPAFLARVAPRVAIVAAEGGKKLPNLEVLHELEAAGITVLRTDLNGAVTVRMTGTELRIRTASGERFLIPLRHPEHQVRR